MFLVFSTNTATTAIYTLSLHDALPISAQAFADSVIRLLRDPAARVAQAAAARAHVDEHFSNKYVARVLDRKSTRLNSSHLGISYAVFCLKKKQQDDGQIRDMPIQCTWT